MILLWLLYEARVCRNIRGGYDVGVLVLEIQPFLPSQHAVFARLYATVCR